MKTRNSILVLVALGAAIAFQACEKSEKIDDFPLVDPALVVNGFFSQNERIAFTVSRSLSVLDNAELKMIDNARVLIYEDGLVVDSLSSAGIDNTYLSQVIPKAGKAYRLELNHANYDQAISGEEYLPESIPVHSGNLMILDSNTYEMYIDDQTTQRRGYADFRAEVSFIDPAASENFYVLRLMQIDTTNPWDEPVRYTPNIISSDLALDNEASIFSGSNASSMLFFTDQVFNGDQYTIQFTFYDWDFSFEKQYYVELSSLSRSAYLYLRTREAFFRSQDDPFAEPVKVYNNIEGGYGIFAGLQKEYFQISY